MLKVTMHDSAGELRFHLEGRLCGAFVGELRQCWLTARSTVRGRKTTLDLREVDYVDTGGEALLREMYREGVALSAVTPIMRDLVEGIEGSSCATVEEAPSKSSHAVPRDPKARHRRAI